MAPDHDDEAPLALRVSRLVWRVDALERNVRALEKTCAGLRGDVDGLTLDDKVAEGVRKALENRTEAVATRTAQKVSVTGGPVRFTWVQRIGGAIAGAVLLLDAIRGLLS